MKIVRRLSYACFNILCILSFCCNSFLGITAKAYTPIEAVIQVSCLEMKDTDGHTYEIAIESEDSGSPIPSSDILQITESGAGEFTIEITEPGTYVYKIYEKPGANSNIIYDDTVYYVTVFVTNAEDDGLCYAVSASVSNKTSKPEMVIFRDSVLGETVSSTVVTTVTAVTTETTAAVVTTDTLDTTETTDSFGSIATTVSSEKDETTTVFSETVTSTNTSGNTSAITNLIHNILTGDSTPIGLLLALMIISAIVGAIMVILKKCKKE